MIGEIIVQAVKDPGVTAILLDIDSPGGTVDGTAALARIVFRAKDTKPIVAFANGLMASAAYWIGSAADYIIAPKTGEVGSIGAVQAHYDYSRADAKARVRRTYKETIYGWLSDDKGEDAAIPPDGWFRLPGSEHIRIEEWAVERLKAQRLHYLN